MSICTQTGDDGTTGLLFNRRVPKTHPRLEAYGSCDELNVSMGMVKAILVNAPLVPDREDLHRELEGIQKTLVDLMGELATLPADEERFLKAGHRRIAAEDVTGLTSRIHELEAGKPSFAGWATPGKNMLSASLDVARTACRRAERRVWELGDEVTKSNPHLPQYLNRLSDFLWLLARKLE